MVDTVHWHLDLRIGGESIQGAAYDDAGRRTSFDGWLSLIALVQRAQAQLGADPAASEPPGLEPAPDPGRVSPRPPDIHPPERGAS